MNVAGLTLSVSTLLLAALPISAQAHEVGGGEHGPSVVSLDWGAADTLDELGLAEHLVGVPHQSAPAYVSHLVKGRADIGGLKEPDVEAIAGLEPDLILVTGRQSGSLEALKAVAETRDVTLEEGNYFEALSGKVLSLASPYHAEEKAREKLAALESDIATAREGLAENFDALVVIHNDGRYVLRQEPIVTELLQIDQPALPNSVEPVSRGERTFYPLTPANIAEMAPDTLYVVDRSAAIGQTPMDADALKAALADAGGADIGVTVLSPGLWYLSGNGLQSVRAQMNEILEGL
ncbi:MULTISPECIES: ABC transporter substrate-binding protein [Cobetia]|uniref:ABC transporter substrate-binding protein n=1 Tax=Cobetia TaxID=204286 RepID=UPI00158266A7|nr:MULTISPECIES: ABC transporter substrate-binding protein [Cobetia]MDI4662512.1 ABC transporter substrate-binding protein [Cobetia sp. BMC6]NUJ57664.1 ABC transporter substrate-binding protein [Cobetia marina]